MTPILLHIVILQTRDDVWCDLCGVPCATTVVYVEESDDRAPDSVRRVTYCETCASR